MAAGLFRRVAVKVNCRQWAWPDQAHLALEHVPELRQLIEAGASQELSPSGQAILVAAFAVAHGAELKYRKGASSSACTVLPKKNGFAELDQLQGNYAHKRYTYCDYKHNATDDVENTLHGKTAFM
jgi:hypothetical protein